MPGHQWTRFGLLVGFAVGGDISLAQRLRYINPQDESPDTKLKAEDKHKFLWDGKELEKAPNLFAVNDEVMMLPEVLSNLDFTPREHAADDDSAAQLELRQSRTWGRVYLEGWPCPIQYMRGHFGGPPGEGSLEFTLANPLEACAELEDTAGYGNGTVVVAMRGTCTWGTKAKQAEAAGAGGILIINNQEGLVHPPGPDAPDLGIFVGVIPQAEGAGMLEHLRTAPLQGHLVPINCHKNAPKGGEGELCHPTTAHDRAVVKDRIQGGYLELPTGERFEYLLATFGVKVPAHPVPIARPTPADLCTTPEPAETFRHRAVVGHRGNCSFIDKAANASVASPAAVIVANTDEDVIAVGADHRWRGANLTFPTVVVSRRGGEALGALPEGAEVTFRPSRNVTAEGWRAVSRLRDPASWLQSAEDRRALYDQARASSAGSEEQLASLAECYAFTSSSEAPVALHTSSSRGHIQDPAQGATSEL